MKLYEINVEILNCINDDGEIDVEKLTALTGEWETKMLDLACWVKDIKKDIEKVANEIKTLQERKKQAENQAENLRELILRELDGKGKNRLSDGRAIVNIPKARASVNVLDEKLIPKKFFIAQEPKLSKECIKEVLEGGGIVKGAELVYKRGVSIK